MTLYSARDLAVAWLSVSVASSKDKASPSLDRTVLVEQFTEGVRLVATDRLMLLTSWVPNVEHPDAPPPPLHELPWLTAVPIDTYGRARSLMAHALTLADQAEEDPEMDPVEVSLRLGLVELLADEDRPTLDGLEPEFVAIEVPDRERLRLRVYEGTFPGWRTVLLGWKASPANMVALGGERLTVLGKLARYHGDRPLGLTFGGEGRPVRVETITGWPHVEGVVMPCRWDLDDNEPWQPGVDDEPPEPAE